MKYIKYLKTKKQNMKQLIFILLFIIPIIGISQDTGTVVKYYVSDRARTMTLDEVSKLENQIADIKSTSTVEIALVTTETLGDKSIEDWTLEIGRNTGVGGKSNNGIVILVASKERKWRIEVGPGLQGVIPDITASDLGKNYLVPGLKSSNYYQGFHNLLEQINNIIVANKNEVVGNENKAQTVSNNKESEDNTEILYYILGFLIILFCGYYLFKIINKQIKNNKKTKINYQSKLNDLSDKIKNLKERIILINENYFRTDSIMFANFLEIKSNYFKYILISKEWVSNNMNIKELDEEINKILLLFPNLSKDSDYISNMINLQNRLKRYKQLDLNVEFLAFYNDLKNELPSDSKLDELTGFDTQLKLKKAKLINETNDFIDKNITDLINDFTTAAKNNDLKKCDNILNSFETYKNGIKTPFTIFQSIYKTSSNKLDLILTFLRDFNSKITNLERYLTVSFISPLNKSLLIEKIKELKQKFYNYTAPVRRYYDQTDYDIIIGFNKSFEESLIPVRKEETLYNNKIVEENRLNRQKEENERKERNRKANSYYNSSYQSTTIIDNNSNWSSSNNDSWSNSSSDNSSSSGDSFSGGSFDGGGSSGDF